MIEISVDPRRLYQGCIQAAVAHAVAVGMYPELNYEHSWDGINYCINDSGGCKAAITFHKEYIVAVFQDIHSADKALDALSFFDGASREIISLAKNEALQYMLEDVEGLIKPVITAAFWGTWSRLYSTGNLNDIIENGGHIIDFQLQSYGDAMDAWRDYYDLDERQVALARWLFERKIHSNGKTIELCDDEIQLLYGDVEECLISLGELNFIKMNDAQAKR